MTAICSAYLHFLRPALAVALLLFHANEFPGNDAMRRIAPKAVEVFFVFSGFVIGYVAANRERTLLRFTAGRSIRILSVSLPALVITFLADAAGQSVAPSLYTEGLHQPGQFDAYVRSLVFLNESWTDRYPGSNIPYWTMGFEVPYYAAFALAFFLPRRFGIPLSLLMMLIAGPDAASMAPIWLSGVAAYVFTLPRGCGLPVFAAASLALVLYAAGSSNGVYWMSAEYSLGQSTLTGALVALQIAGLNAGTAGRRIPQWLAEAGRRMSGAAFSIYLYHFPLMVLAQALVGHAYSLDVILPLAAAAGLSRITESRHSWWHRRLTAAVTSLEAFATARLHLAAR